MTPQAQLPNRPKRFERWLGPRGRSILHTGTWSMIAKASAAANLFIAVPFVLEALGAAQFGAWATLVSLVTFAGFLDFGLGNGTMNLIASARGRNNSAEIALIFYQGRRVLVRIAYALAGTSLVATFIVPWHVLLGLPESDAGIARNAVAVVLFSVVLAVPLSLTNRVLLGLGNGDLAFRWQAVAQWLTLACVVASAKAHGSLVLLTAAAVSTPLLASIANSWRLWRAPLYRHRTEYSSNPAGATIARQIRHEGLLFFVLQISAALAFSADLPLIAAIRGSSEAGTYAIIQRLYSVIPMGLSLIWIPLWPIYRQALAARDHIWVIRTLRRSLLLAVLASLLGALMLTAGFEQLVGIWVRQPIIVSTILLLGFVVWSVADAAGNALSTFMNAASVMRYQISVSLLFACTCVVAKAYAISAVGIAIVPWVTVITYSLLSLMPTLLLAPRIISGALAKDL